MLTEMARMSLEDGLVMQIHPGSARNHNRKALLSDTAATWERTSRRRQIMWTRFARCSISSAMSAI